MRIQTLPKGRWPKKWASVWGSLTIVLKELIKKGFVKINRFKSSDNKATYMYILTPHGIEEKTKITSSFLKRKMDEFEDIKRQIIEISLEVNEEKNDLILFDKGLKE